MNKPKRDLRPALVSLNGDLIAVPILLEREQVTLGRALEADVRINDFRVSRQHAQIITVHNAEDDSNIYLLRDLHSRNGTVLNGQKIIQETLQNGDKITIGDQIFSGSI